MSDDSTHDGASRDDHDAPALAGPADAADDVPGTCGRADCGAGIYTQSRMGTVNGLAPYAYDPTIVYALLCENGHLTREEGPGVDSHRRRLG